MYPVGTKRNFFPNNPIIEVKETQKVRNYDETKNKKTNQITLDTIKTANKHTSNIN